MRPYELAVKESLVRLFAADGGWRQPRLHPSVQPSGLRDHLETLVGRRFLSGAVLVSRRAEDEIAYDGPRDLCRFGGRWKSMSGEDGGCPLRNQRVNRWGRETPTVVRYSPGLSSVTGGRSRLWAYTDPSRTFTCLAGNQEAPFVRMMLDGELRLGRPVQSMDPGTEPGDAPHD